MTATVAGDYLTERIGEAERYLFLLEEMDAGLRDGTIHWSQFNDELTCPNRQEAAVDECGTALDFARKDLEALQAEAARRAQDTEWGDAS